jgi:predicted kinase
MTQFAHKKTKQKKKGSEGKMSAKKKKQSSSSSAKKRTLPECWFIVTVGLPGSGKSYFAQALEARGWVRASQDDLGTQDEVRKLIERALKHRRSAVLDRCCVHAKERRMWLQLLQRACDSDSSPVIAESVFFDVGVDECKRRVLARKGHPNLQGEGSGAVIDEFARGLEPPQEREGFARVHTVRSAAEATLLARTIAGYPICEKGV